MIRKNNPTVQIQVNGEWKHIFCYSVSEGRIITTADKRKGIYGDQSNLSYFRDKTSLPVRIAQ